MSEFGIGARLPRLEDARFLKAAPSSAPTSLCPGHCTRLLSEVRTPTRASFRAANRPDLRSQSILPDDLVGVGRLRSTAKMPGFKPSDWPILAKGKVRHVGEPVAMVIGATPAEAEDFAALVEVEFEPLPPIVSMADALQKASRLFTTNGATTSWSTSSLRPAISLRRKPLPLTSSSAVSA